MTVLALVIAAAPAAVLFAPALALQITAFVAAGIANAYFFAATLAARSEYSPAAARGQVFVWVGALKITANSAGTAAAGALIATSVQLPLIIAIAVSALAALASVVDRRRTLLR